MDSGLDKALAVIEGYKDSQSQESELLVLCKCAALMEAYDSWSPGEWECVSAEEQFHLPIVNPETSKHSRTYQQAGRYDGIVRQHGKTYLLEHKTTTDDISDPNAHYWRRLAIDSQVSIYMLANWQSGRKLDGTLYDVLRKPTIRPKRLEKNAVARIVAYGDYCGVKVPDAVRVRVAGQQQTDECLTLYGIRLLSDALERPTFYFGRKIIPRTDRDLLDWAAELWDVSQEIREANTQDRHYRNPNACLMYGTPCEFLGICSGYDDPYSDKWRTTEGVHVELELPKKVRHKDVLTHSRITTFLTCRKKHHLRYNLGLRRVDEDERESIFFGTVWHAAQAAWWLCKTPGEAPCPVAEPSPA